VRTGEIIARLRFPHVDGSPRICELVEYHLEDIDLKGVWAGPGALTLNAHALAPVAELPVLEVVSTAHLVADLTLGLGRVVHDYLEPAADLSDAIFEKLSRNAA
jgi:acetoacetate decarboxylase